MVPACRLPAGRRGRQEIGRRSYTINNLMYCVYSIKSRGKNYIYVGITNDIERRTNEHNKGWVKTTRSFAPFKTVLVEKYPTRIEAREREKYLKSGCGKEYLKNII